MILWVDAQLSPRTARWISENFSVTALALREIGLRDSPDEEIFSAARLADAVVVTKDSDFVQLLERKGSPPRVLWLTCGNTSEKALQEILGRHLNTALSLLQGGECLVEIGSP